jgi:Ca2+-binding RTX toxin-like protein
VPWRAGPGRGTELRALTVRRNGAIRGRPFLVRSVVVGLALLGTMTPTAAPAPAGLHNLHPTHFNGDDRGHGPDLPGGADGDAGETNEGQIASDRFDGVDSLYTMRAVAGPEAHYYSWFQCETSSSAFDPSTCQLIARDSTPKLSFPPSGVARVAAFEATYNIPGNLQFGRTFRTLACIDGPPPRAAHCVGDRTVVHFDDASSTGDHSSTTDGGHIVQPSHGGAVPNAGFTAVAYTSETDIGQVLFCLDVGTNPGHAEDASPSAGCDQGSAHDRTPDDSPECSSVPAGANCWEVTIDPPDNSEFSLGIVEQDDPTDRVSGGDGDCEGDTFVGGDGSNDGDDCQLDKIYVTSLVAPPTGSTCPGFKTAQHQVVGDQGSDVLRGTPDRDVICGLGGNDLIRGMGKGDVLLGGAGNDRLIGQAGPDRLRGDPGSDTLRGGKGKDGLTGGPGIDRCVGGRGGGQPRCER